jgi:hypothetical protein
MPSVSVTYFVFLGLVSAIVLLLLGGAIGDFSGLWRRSLAALFALSASLCLVSAYSLNAPSSVVRRKTNIRR